MKVRVCVDDDQGSYVLHCPHCTMAVAKAAEPHVVQLLVAAGSPLTMWRLPAELAEAHAGPPVSHDELLAFHDLLERPDWFAQVASTVEDQAAPPAGRTVDHGRGGYHR